MGILAGFEWGGRERVLRNDRLTGTNFQYHLLGDLMEDDDWTATRESGRGVRPRAIKNS